MAKIKKILKNFIGFCVFSALFSQNLCENSDALAKPKNLKSNIKTEDQVDINNNRKTDLMYKKEENLFQESFNKDVKITGKFHFFNSFTNENTRKNKDLEQLMQGDGRVNFFYEKKIDDNYAVYSSFEVKKKYDNKTALKSLIGVKSEKFGDIKIASFNPIFDDFVTPFDIIVSSNGAWLRNINSEFPGYPDYANSSIINDIDSVIGFYTDHDLTSIMYKTKEIKGLSFSVSYTNDTRYKKKALKNFPYKDVLSFLGTFEKKICDDLKFSISAMTEFGSSYPRDLNNNGTNIDDPMLDDLRSFLISGSFEYQKFQFAMMYANFFKTNRFESIPVIENVDITNIENAITQSRNFVEPKNIDYFSVAASYKLTDKFKASIYHFFSESGQDYAAVSPVRPSTAGFAGQIKFRSTSIAASYELFENSFAPYIEFTKFKVKDNDAVIASDRQKDNDGYVVTLGVKAAF